MHDNMGLLLLLLLLCRVTRRDQWRGGTLKRRKNTAATSLAERQCQSKTPWHQSGVACFSSWFRDLPPGLRSSTEWRWTTDERREGLVVSVIRPGRKPSSTESGSKSLRYIMYTYLLETIYSGGRAFLHFASYEAVSFLSITHCPDSPKVYMHQNYSLSLYNN